MNRTRLDQQRLVGLELLRFLAAVGVLVWHYQHFTFGGAGGVVWSGSQSQMPLRWLLAPFYAYGFAGVQLFWCISGFIFTWKYGDAVARAELPFGRLAILRFSRLYPLHLATLLIVLVLQWVYFARYGQSFVYGSNSGTDFVANLVFLNWWNSPLTETFNGPSWSVAAEVYIYCVFFCVARRVGTGWRIDMMMLYCFIAVNALAQSLFVEMAAFTGAGLFFYAGALVCRAYQRIETLSPGWRHLTACGCAGLVGLYIALLAANVIDISSAIQTMFPATVLLAQLAVRPVRARTRRLLVGLGNLTYASYMVHFPMQLATMLMLGAFAVPARPLLHSAWFMLGYLGAVLASSFVIFHCVERPAQTWLRGLGRKVRPIGTARPFVVGL